MKGSCAPWCAFVWSLYRIGKPHLKKCKNVKHRGLICVAGEDKSLPTFSQADHKSEPLVQPEQCSNLGSIVATHTECSMAQWCRRIYTKLALSRRFLAAVVQVKFTVACRFMHCSWEGNLAYANPKIGVAVLQIGVLDFSQDGSTALRTPGHRGFHTIANSVDRVNRFCQARTFKNLWKWTGSLQNQ